MKGPSKDTQLGFLYGWLASRIGRSSWVGRLLRRVAWALAIPLILAVSWIIDHPVATVVILGLVAFVLLSLWSARLGGRRPLTVPPQLERTALYRWYDVDSRLLYVGITNHLMRRAEQHSDDKPWWSQVASSVVEWHPTRQAALAAETNAIHTEHPVHNIAQNSRRSSWR